MLTDSAVLTPDQIIEAIWKTSMNRDQANKIINAAVSARNLIREADIGQMMSRLEVGLRVGFGKKGNPSPKRSYKEGVITKLRRKKVEVIVEGIIWTVPATLITILQEDTK